MTIKLNKNEIVDIKNEISYMQLKGPEHKEIHEKSKFKLPNI